LVLVFFRAFFARSFCVTHYANAVELSAMLVPNEKSSANCIWCISYTRAGNDSGKLPGMTELAEIQLACLARLCRFACG
jgi:hypothetical protein